MSDPLRTNPIENTASTDGDAERDAKIESLLLAGLDQYFAADYAQAIDIWTRALFLDRNHARARAYIERAQKRHGRAAARVGGAAAQRRGGVRAWRDRGGAADAECRGAARRRARRGARISHAHRSHPRGDASAAGADGAAVEAAVPAAHGDVAQSGIAVGERGVRRSCSSPPRPSPSPRGIGFASGCRR